jgi:hypothetical protein
MKYKSPITYHSKDMANVKVFLKSGSNFKVTRSKIMVPLESSCHKEDTSHMKYESPITYHSKYMANVKVFEKWVRLQGQGHKIKILIPIERSCHKEHTYEI